jgi:hypothetical protein
MSQCDVDAKYINPSCGRTSLRALEKPYLDYSPERLMETYDEAGFMTCEYICGSPVVEK